MSNPYYNSTFTAAPLTLIRSATANAQFSLIAAGFDAVYAVTLPMNTEVVAAREGQASLLLNIQRRITASVGLTQDLNCNGFKLTGAPASGYGANDLIPRSYADALAMNAINLPAQTGNNGKYVKTDGTNASWENPHQKYEAERAVRQARQLTFA